MSSVIDLLSIVPGTVVSGVSWEDYETLQEALDERGHRINYDRGRIEVLMPSHLHERVGDTLGSMVDILSDEWRIECEAGGSTTHKRADLKKAVEPDKCYWIGPKAATMASNRPLDLAVDPAPSLVIEVNYTSSSIDRMSIYAALGVDEVWRWDDGLVFLTLVDGDYRPIAVSGVFPMLSLATAREFLKVSDTISRFAFREAFRRHIRADRPQA